MLIMNVRSLSTIFRDAFRRNRVPALVLQGFAALLLALYFLVPMVRPVFDILSAAKLQYGYLFSGVAGMIFGGLIPWAVIGYRKRIPEGQVFRQFLFYILFFSGQSMIVDALYRQQAIWFGDAVDPKTLLLKVLVDQLPFNLLWSTPVSLFFFTWKDNRFSLADTLRDLRISGGRRYISIQLGAWMIWVPAVAMIYSLPLPLQIPFFNLVLCFFTLVLTFVTRETH